MDTIDLPRFEDRLWGELEQLFHEPELAPAPEEPRGRRRVYVLAAAGLSAAACLAAAVLVTNQGDDSEPKDTGTAESTTTVQEAVADAALVVMEGPHGTTWFDESTGAARVATAAAEHVTRPTGGQSSLAEFEITTIDHQSRTYWRHRSVSGPAGRDITVTGALDAEVAAGTLTADGSEVVDGRELLRYAGPPGSSTKLCGITGDPRGFTSDQCGQPGVEETTLVTVQRVVWVDPATGRPAQASGDYDLDGQVETATFAYLSRTPGNLALLEGEVPADYTEGMDGEFSSSVVDLLPPGLAATVQG